MDFPYKSDISIREASINDAKTIQQLAEQTWWPVYSPLLKADQIVYMLSELYSIEKITWQISTGTQTYLLLIADGQPMAFAAYSPREENPEIYKLHKLYCLPSAQGKGYGKVLINAVIEKILTAGKHILELNVNRQNKAKTFYEKMGFTIVDEEDIPIGPYWMNDYVMRKEL